MRRMLFVAAAIAAAFASASLAAAGSSKIPQGFVEVPSGSLSSDRFVVDLKYASDTNFLGRNVYAAHGVHSCYVHPLMAERLARLAPILAKKKLKLVLWDCFR
nr:M15 family metallopeptidase [bacterium]